MGNLGQAGNLKSSFEINLKTNILITHKHFLKKDNDTVLSAGK